MSVVSSRSTVLGGNHASLEKKVNRRALIRQAPRCLELARSKGASLESVVVAAFASARRYWALADAYGHMQRLGGGRPELLLSRQADLEADPRTDPGRCQRASFCPNDLLATRGLGRLEDL